MCSLNKTPAMHGFAGDNGNLVFSFICTLLALYQLYALFERTLCKKALETHTHTHTIAEGCICPKSLKGLSAQRNTFGKKKKKQTLVSFIPLIFFSCDKTQISFSTSPYFWFI